MNNPSWFDKLEQRIHELHENKIDRIGPNLEGVVDQPTPPHDPVNRPAHYTTGTIEVLDFIEDQQFGYLDGQVIKYVSRYRHKGKPLEDLQKAKFYLERLLRKESHE